MTNTFKRNIKKKLSLLARVLIVIVAIIKIVHYFQDEEEKTSKTDNPVVHEPISENKELKEDSIIPAPKQQQTPPKAATVKIEEVILYKGKLVNDAYFTVTKCNSCKSSITKSNGIAIAHIPKEIYNSNREYDFYVFKENILLYHKSMRFTDLQFNK